MSRLALPTVTLCAAASVNVLATVEALLECIRQIEFSAGLLFTDSDLPEPHPELRVVRIGRLKSAADYSDFVLRRIGDHIDTPHCLVVQWDGFVLDARRWSRDFLNFDYVGAPWPQFGDQWSVGNGGFSLRSRRLLKACQDPSFAAGHPEDVAICRSNRIFLEKEHGIRFATPDVAARFSIERTSPPAPTFGFHGIFNMIPLLSPEHFWETYLSLDDRSTAFVDYRLLMRQLGQSNHAMSRRAHLTLDRLIHLFKR